MHEEHIRDAAPVPWQHVHKDCSPGSMQVREEEEEEEEEAGEAVDGELANDGDDHSPGDATESISHAPSRHSARWRNEAR